MKEKIIVISAVWCPSCLILKRHLKKLTEEYNLEFQQLDYDLDEDEIQKYNIGDILPVIIFGDKRLTGEKSFDEIKSFLKDCDVL